MDQTQAEALNRQFSNSTAQEALQYFCSLHGQNAVFTTSLGLEDQVLTHMICTRVPGVRIATLDTGRLFEETYQLLDQTVKHFGVKIEVYFPEQNKVEEMVKSRGVNLFYNSVENRKLCCHVRKTESLRRALAGASLWITGIRREQSVTRYSSPMVEWNEQYDLMKLNPLKDWSEQMVWDYIRSHNIPYNPLHDKGFPSIGCSPCTRAVREGEDLRAGRWWWEQPENKECGLHVHPKNQNLDG